MLGRRFVEIQGVGGETAICLVGCSRLRITAIGDASFTITVSFVPGEVEGGLVPAGAAMNIASWVDANGLDVVLADLPCYARYAVISWSGDATEVNGEAIAIA